MSQTITSEEQNAINRLNRKRSAIGDTTKTRTATKALAQLLDPAKHSPAYILRMRYLGQAFILWREAQGLTQTEAGRAAELSGQTVHRLESGYFNLTTKTINDLLAGNKLDAEIMLRPTFLAEQRAIKAARSAAPGSLPDLTVAPAITAEQRASVPSNPQRPGNGITGPKPERALLTNAEKRMVLEPSRGPEPAVTIRTLTPETIAEIKAERASEEHTPMPEATQPTAPETPAQPTASLPDSVVADAQALAVALAKSLMADSGVTFGTVKATEARDLIEIAAERVTLIRINDFAEAAITFMEMPASDVPVLRDRWAGQSHTLTLTHSDTFTRMRAGFLTSLLDTKGTPSLPTIPKLAQAMCDTDVLAPGTYVIS